MKYSEKIRIFKLPKRTNQHTSYLFLMPLQDFQYNFLAVKELANNPMPGIKADAILYSVLKIKQKYSVTFQQFPIDNAFTD